MYKWKKDNQNNDMCRNHIHYVLEAIQGIYDSEINISISSFWDGGWNAQIGDDMNGFKDSAAFDCIEECLDWLIHRVVDIYPNSTYAANFKAGIYFP